MVFQKTFFISLFLVLGCLLFGDSWNTFTVDLSTTFTRDVNENYYFLPLGKGTMSFEMDTDRNIKGGIELGLDPSLPFPLTLDRMFIKARFDDFRLTMGKTRLPWGRGILFNAGDIIWDSTSLVTNLGAQEFRTDASFLLSPYLSLGRFAFLEVVLLTPDINPLAMLTAQLNGSPIELPKAQELRAGIHGQSKFLGADIETAYLYEGAENSDDGVHKAMVSVFFSPYMDLYASVSSAMPQNVGDSETYEEQVYENLKVSMGTFYSLSFDSGATLSGRLEALLFPAKKFEALTTEERNAGDSYGLFLYPEISFSPEPIMQFFMRSIVSPVDLSALLLLGASFETYQDLNFYVNSGIMLGEDDDLYSFEHDKGIFVQTGIKYIY